MKKFFRWRKSWSFKNLFLNILVFFVAIGIIGLGASLIWVSTLKIPNLDTFATRIIKQSTKIYDRTGEVLLYDLHQDVKRTVLPFDDISPFIKNATIAIEDDNFYNHIGIEPKSILRAVLANLSEGDLLGGQGGSTLTQQIIKNALLQKDKTITRKVTEWILAIKLERKLSKDEILAIYLNESPYGGTIYGVEEAAQYFFGKHARDVSLAEAAYIASVPQAPTRLSPYGSHKDDLDKRQQLTLQKMLENNLITTEDYEVAKNEEVFFIPQNPNGLGSIKAPHFVMYLREQLVEKYGEKVLSENGWKITTTLDWDLQKEAERIVAEKGLVNVEKYNADNAGLVAVDPKTGDLLAMVGSRDYFNEEIDGNFNVTLAPRQPGSSIKPFIYATAFTKGYLPDTVVFDVKTQFGVTCPPDSWSSESPCYSPSNYNGKYIGPISLRNALAQSLNIPAVKVLYLAGIKNSLKLASDMGITTLESADRYGLTLVLGSGEVRLLDMTYAYGVFANKGIKAAPRDILKIEDSNGNVIEDSVVTTKRILDENITAMISDILSDDEARSPLWGRNSIVNFSDRDVASKTGSTNNLKDAWLMGYAPNLVVGAWVGNNDNAAMGGGLSGLIVTPMWREVMNYGLAKLPKEEFPEPEINKSGVKPMIRGEYIDTSRLIDMVQSGQELNFNTLYENVHTILYFVDKNNPNGPAPLNPASDNQFHNWEWAVQAWKKETYGLLEEVTTNNQPTTSEQNEDSGNNNNEEDEDD